MVGNIPFEPAAFDALYKKVTAYISNKEIYVRDSYVCADPNYRLNVRVITETPWANLFYNMFLRPTAAELISRLNGLYCAYQLYGRSCERTRQSNLLFLTLPKSSIDRWNWLYR
jgi:phosphoenolpyruvate carboxykinase (ATP)